MNQSLRQIKAVCKAVLLTYILCCASIGNAQTEGDVVQLFKTNIPTPDVDAKAWALLEVSSGMIIAGKNTDQQFPPASITKLMTNYIAFNKLRDGEIALNDAVTISEKAWRTGGSRMFAKVGSKIDLVHVLKSTIIQSGNDAAVALAEHIGGSELGFTQLMNQAAAELGLGHSHFVNATGLPAPQHAMSARDIAVLSAAIIEQHPQYYRWYSEKEYTHNNITQYNRNKLLWKDSTVDGLKTGFTEAAGYCLVGSASRNEQRWIAVVLGSNDEASRAKAVLELLDFAFAAFTPIRVLDQQGGLKAADVYMGEVDKVQLRAQGPVYLVVPVGREQDVVSEFRLSPYYRAPIEIDQAMGVVSLSLDNKLLVDVPLISMSTIKEGGWWDGLIDGARLKIRELRE
jgi:D-alanyl-D-alanine carboxypeptidase (penicillin-binding protein 5/6)